RGSRKTTPLAPPSQGGENWAQRNRHERVVRPSPTFHRARARLLPSPSSESGRLPWFPRRSRGGYARGGHRPAGTRGPHLVHQVAVQRAKDQRSRPWGFDDSLSDRGDSEPDRPGTSRHETHLRAVFSLKSHSRLRRQFINTIVC